MALSVQKRFPLPPAIVIELPNNSPTQSSFSSHEEIDVGEICSKGEYTTNPVSPTGSPFTKHVKSNLPEVVSESKMINHAVKDPDSPSKRIVCNPFIVCHDSMTSIHGLLPQYWSTYNYNDNAFLNVPQPSRSLRHSTSLRSTKSFTRSNQSPCECSHRKQRPIITQSGRSSHCYLISNNSRTNLSNYSICEVTDENYKNAHNHPHLQSSELTSVDSSSVASSLQLSQQLLPHMSPQSIRLPHTIDSENQSNIKKKIRRSTSLVETGSQHQSHRRSTLTNVDGLSIPVPKSSRNRMRCQKYCSHATCRLKAPKSQKPPCMFQHTGEIGKDPRWNDDNSYNLDSLLAHRRHTDGSDTRLNYLNPFVLVRRSNSISTHTAQFLPDKLSPIHPQLRRSCMSCIQAKPEPHNSCLSEDRRHGCVIESANQQTQPSPSYIDLETGTAMIEDPPKAMSTSSIDSVNENVGGVCFCPLIVLLVIMQIVLGICTVGVGTYLHLTVPLLHVEECAFWAALPITVTGFLGIYFCVQTRRTCGPHRITAVLLRISAILSLISCIVCLVASVFSGRRGNSIASYDASCILAPKTNYSRALSHHAPQSINLPCCTDEVTSENHPSCHCYGENDQLIWQHLSCRVLFSTVKDYLILQSALMAVGAGVCLWFWTILTEQRLTNAIMDIHQNEKKSKTGKKQSSSSTCQPETTTTTATLDGKTSTMGNNDVLPSKLNLMNSIDMMNGFDVSHLSGPMQTPHKNRLRYSLDIGSTMSRRKPLPRRKLQSLTSYIDCEPTTPGSNVSSDSISGKCFGVLSNSVASPQEDSGAEEPLINQMTDGKSEDNVNGKKD